MPFILYTKFSHVAECAFKLSDMSVDLLMCQHHCIFIIIAMPYVVFWGIGDLHHYVSFECTTQWFKMFIGYTPFIDHWQEHYLLTSLL